MTGVTGPRRTRLSQRGTVAALLLGTAAVLLDIGGASPTLRLPVTLVFLLVGPGIVLAPLVGLPDRLSTAVLVVALSITVDILVSQVLLYTVGFTWRLGLLVVDVFCVFVAAARMAPALGRDWDGGRPVGGPTPGHEPSVGTEPPGEGSW